MEWKKKRRREKRCAAVGEHSSFALPQAHEMLINQRFDSLLANMINPANFSLSLAFLIEKTTINPSTN